MGEPIHSYMKMRMQKWLKKKKTKGHAPFNSLADVLTESNECRTRVVDLIYKSVVLYVDTARMLIFPFIRKFV